MSLPATSAISVLSVLVVVYFSLSFLVVLYLSVARWLSRHTVGLFQHLPASVSHVHVTFAQLHTFLTSPVQSQSAAPDRRAAPLELRFYPAQSLQEAVYDNTVGLSWIRNVVGHVTDNRLHCEVLFPVCCFSTVFCSCRDVLYITKQNTALMITFLNHGLSVVLIESVSVWTGSVAAAGGSVQSRYEDFSIISS